ncbi:hypothetical protein ERC79_16675 [Rhodococcus sp. ABRD24]|uniref:hypothetical protein n=1 Tax=Rhodococcus sp. ABRD24 TaxID=2507582 RepID=UPI0010386539|nr:hypothetical protein [Rhodococcus sp. ABRD24]QBJ97390.1 hypothetical protein ERC79_16675 [Rhodococcus sp. ABRD24]
MPAVVTPSVHDLLREFVANCPRRRYLHEIEGIELSNQAAFMREVVVTVQACLEPHIAELRRRERGRHALDPNWTDGPGMHLIASIAQFEEILATLLDATRLVETARMSTAWTLLGSAVERLEVLTALESPDGPQVASQLVDTAARARAELSAVAATGGVDLQLPATLPSSIPTAAEQNSPIWPMPNEEVATLLDAVGRGADTSRDGGPLSIRCLLGSPDETDYDQLAAVGGYLHHLVLRIVQAATDALCAVAARSTRNTAWDEWAADVRAGVEFAWDCV